MFERNLIMKNILRTRVFSAGLFILTMAATSWGTMIHIEVETLAPVRHRFGLAYMMAPLIHLIAAQRHQGTYRCWPKMVTHLGSTVRSLD